MSNLDLNKKITLRGVRIHPDLERDYCVSDDDANFYSITQGDGDDMLWLADMADKPLALSVAHALSVKKGYEVEDLTF